MKVLEINKAFRKFGEIQVKFRWLFLLGMFVITAIGLSGLRKFVAEDLQEDWFGDKEKIKLATDRFEETFGNEDVITVLVQSNNIFDSDVLNMIDRLGNEMMETIPYARDVMSVVEVSVAKGTDDGMQVVTPFEDGIPDTHTAEGKAEMESIKKFLLSREAIANKLVSEDATETWVILYLYGYGEEDNKARTGMYKAGRAAHKLLEDPKWQSDKWNLICAGTPYTECEESDVMRKEMSRNLISGFIAMIICLILFVRSLRGLIVPLFSTVGGIGVVFGFMSYFGIVADQNMMTIPILLGMALSVGYSIHYINSFKLHFRQTGLRKESVITSVEETGWPLFFTVVTTAASVLSFLTTDLKPIRWMGATSAAMVFAVYIYVSVLIPILMSFGKDIADAANAHTKSAAFAQKTDARFEHFGRSVIKRRKAVIVAFTLITAACIPALFKIDVNMDSFKFMGLRIPYIRRIYEITQSQLGSYFNYNIMLTFDEDDAVKNPDVLKKIDELSTLIGSFKLTKLNNGVPKIFSILDIVKEMNQTMHADDPAFYTIPDDEDLLAQLLFLYEISGGQTSRWVDEEFRTLRMSIDVASYDANELAANLKTIEQTCAELFPQADCHLIGAAVQFAELNNKIVFGELYSFFTSLVAIAILMMLVFGSVKMGLIGLIPNIFPVLVIGAIMGYLGISLDLMTMAIMPMILGIAVDDTIHFTNHAKYLFEKEKSYDRAIFGTFYSIGKTLAMTTIILSATFLVYLTCKIDAILRLGVLAAVGLLSALAADYLMTPVLIYISKPFGKEEK